MAGRLLSFFLVLHLALSSAFAANITVGTDPGGGDLVTELRGLAETLLRESGGGPSPDMAPRDRQAALDRLGGAVELNELPDLVSQLAASQKELSSRMQDEFKHLLGAGSVSEADRAEFLKNIERQANVLAADALILQGLQQKVSAAMSDPSLPAAEKARLAAYSKTLAQSISRVQGYQNESSKMIRTEFRRADDASERKAEVESVKAQADIVVKEISGLMAQAEASPAGRSQDFYKEAVGNLSQALENINKLTQQLQDMLNADPSNREAQALLKQLASARTQAASMMRDFAVTEVSAAQIVQAQQIKDELADAVTALKRRLAAIKARDKEDVSKEELEALFAEYDRIAALSEKGIKLGESALKAGAGNKFETAEQRELREVLEGIMGEFGSLGTDAEGLAPGARESVWAEYLKEKEEEAAAGGGGPQPDLNNNVNSGTLGAGPAAVSPLSGAIIGDILKKDSLYYGAVLRNLTASSIGQAADSASLKQADLVVFKVENGAYTSVNLGSFQVYAGAAHAALAVNGAGELAVFLNHTLAGEKAMAGELFTLDAATLAQLTSARLDLAAVEPSASGGGWFPRFSEDGVLLSLYADANSGEHPCLDGVCNYGFLMPTGEFALETEVLRAWHSGGVYSRDDYSGDLPTDVLEGRLTGATETEQLGAFSHLSWGRWNDGAGVADTIHTNSYWLAGTLTPANEVPTDGEAFYTGQVFGKVTEGGTISAVTGTTSLTAHFGNHTLTGTFDMKKNDADWTVATVSAGWSGASVSPAGSLTADNGLKGAVTGNFFGPEAAQVGGAWNLSNGSDVRAAGVFTGERPVAQ